MGKPTGWRRQLAPLLILGSGVWSLAGAVPAVTAASRPQCPGAVLYPSPGSQTAAAGSQISLQHVSPGTLSAAAISVRGSASGSHPGRLVDDSDGDGASFYPDQPFAPGEQVTVTAPVPICGGQGDSATFGVALAAPSLSGPTPKTTPGAPSRTQRFASAPRLRPPALAVSKASPTTAQGDIFLTPVPSSGQAGPMIVNGKGELVWFDPLPQGEMAADLRVQSYRGQPVLTWFQGDLVDGHGVGEFKIMNDRYQTLRTVSAVEGYSADLHEFLLGPDQTAWLAAYSTVGWNLAPEGGPSLGAVYDCVVQELDLRTGNVLFEWHSLDHVSPSASYFHYVAAQSTPLDYFHLNSIDPLKNGTVLISARNTEAAYLVSEASGRTLWTLGGRQSTFSRGHGAAFALQHDVELQGRNTVTVFDDEDTTINGPPARAIELRLDFSTHRARLVWGRKLPGYLLVANQGNVQLLPGGDAVVGWGAGTYTTEYGSHGKLLFEAHFSGSASSYRAYRNPWSGRPRTAPRIATRPAGTGRISVLASWNGSTMVTRWRVLGGASPTHLAALDSASKRGFQTVIPLSGRPAYLGVEALGAGGRVLARSAILGSG
ncbi:MAG: arylsulfotransferase family protein [Candidatus Dormibacteria bacterium]